MGGFNFLFLSGKYRVRGVDLSGGKMELDNAVTDFDPTIVVIYFSGKWAMHRLSNVKKSRPKGFPTETELKLKN